MCGCLYVVVAVACRLLFAVLVVCWSLFIVCCLLFGCKSLLAVCCLLFVVLVFAICC